MRKGYRAARIIDGKGTQPYLKSILIIEGDRIGGIVPEREVGKDLPIFDLGDSTLLPGLIDSHVHLVDDGSALPRKLVENEPGGLTLLRSAQRAFLSLRSGITAMRDMGAPAGIIPTLKDAVSLGVIQGPAIVTCDTQLTITGGYGRKENVLGREADGPDGMRKAVREILKGGADFVKIMASGKVSVAGPALDVPQFTQEEMTSAVDEAHRLGRKVSVHAVGLKAIESSVRVGVDCIEHGSFLTAELAKEMGERGIFQLLVSAGFSPGEALTSATRINAEILGVPEIGSLEKGKLADVVAVDGNPLQDIQVVSRVKMVLKSGREISVDSQLFE